MVKEERFDIILKELKKNTTATYEQLAVLLPVSEDTIRRDVEYLYRNGLLSRIRGGAMLRSKDPLSFQARSSVSKKQKSLIALKAQPFIKNGMTIFMDGGTTICAIARHLPIDISLRVITNNVELVPIFKSFPNVELVLLGGVYNRDMAATTGTETCQEAAKFLADIYFMGTCAIDYELGISAIFKTDAELKRTMIAAAKSVIALADNNKLRHSEPFKVATIDQVDVLISDLPSNHEELELFRNLDIQIV